MREVEMQNAEMQECRMNSVGAHIVRPSMDNAPYSGYPVGADVLSGPLGQRLTSRLSVRPAR